MSDFERLLNAMGVTMSAEFVPASFFKGDEWRSNAINHNVTVRRGGMAINTNYSQGRGHLPKVTGCASDGIDRCERLMIENGEVFKFHPRGPHSTGKQLPEPSMADVMESLLMDAGGSLFSFSDWCGDFGYNDDSIKAKEVFDACRTIKLQMMEMFTRDEIESLNDALRLDEVAA